MWRTCLLGIVVLAFALRVTGLASHPAGFTPDEASFGYDAYSLIKTGRDQWGASWPLTFKSFGDYKLPLYTYLAIPTVSIFGLNEFAVRFPAAILGTLAIISTFLFALEFTEHELHLKHPREIALLSAFLIAISPWHIPLSRGAFEANLTTFLLPLALYFFLRGIQKPWFFIPSSVLFSLNIFSYHSARLVTPLILLALLISFRRRLAIKSFPTILSVSILAVFALLTLFTLFQGGGARFTTATIFGMVPPTGADRYLAIQSGLYPLLSFILYNRPVFIIERFVSSYITYFSPQFLYSLGASEGTYGMLPGVGVLLPVEYLGFILTFIFLLRLRLKFPFWFLFLLFISPIPAAISIGAGYAANRAAILMPQMQIISAIGIITFLEMYTKKTFFKTQIITYLVLLFFGLGSFINWWYLEPIKEGRGMFFGLDAAISEATSNHIIMSKSISEPHMYYAFYTKMDPSLYQQQTNAWKFDHSKVAWVDQIDEYKLGNATFQSIDWVRDTYLKDVSLIATDKETPPHIKTSFVSRLPDGSPVYTVTNLP